MKIEEQVLTIEQMNHLKELGLEVKDTALCWIGKLKYEFSINPHTIFEVEVNKGEKYQYHSIVSEFIPTLTLQEIEVLLPERIDKYDLCRAKNYIKYEFARKDDISDVLFSVSYNKIDNKFLLLGAYEMLCWVLENGYLK